MSWLAVGTVAVGAGSAIYSATQNKGSSNGQRNVGSELNGLPWDQQAKLQKEMSKYQVETLYPMMAAQERKATDKQRKADMIGLGKYGTGITDNIGAINPGWQTALQQLSGSAATAGQPDALAQQMNWQALNTGPSELRTTLQGQALSELGLGSQLTDQQIRDVTQATRAGFNDRGLAMSNPAIGMELLNRDLYGQQRLQQRQGFAANMAQLGLQEDAANRGFQGSVENQNQARMANGQNFQLTNAQVQQGALSPTLGFFGQRTPVSVTAPGSVLAASTGSMQPLMNYGMDAANTNFNANANAAISGRNNNSALLGSLIGAGGQMAGAYIGNMGGGGGGAGEYASPKYL